MLVDRLQLYFLIFVELVDEICGFDLEWGWDKCFLQAYPEIGWIDVFLVLAHLIDHLLLCLLEGPF